MDFLKRYCFKQEIIRLFEKHQDKLIADSGFAVQALHGAETNVYALAYQYCCDNNLHLSCIQKIKWYFKEWVDDMDTDRLMRVW